MFKLNFNDIVSKITEKSGLSEKEIIKRIDEKCEILSGLVSREGAAHIVANELSIKLFEQISGKIQIKDVLSGMKSVETAGMVQQVFPLRTFKRKNQQDEEYEGKVASFVIADETARIRVTLWNDQADRIKELSEGKIIMIKDGMAKDNQGRPEIHLSSRSSLIVDPIGIEIDLKDIAQKPMQMEKRRVKIKDLKDGDTNVELLSFVVNAFEPRFFEVCPKCQKRVRPREDGFFCDEHKEVEPDHSYVLNAVLDDGTETIRAVFFRNHVERLFSVSKQQMLELKDNPDSMQDMVKDILGSHVLLSGRTTKNVMFQRTEFVVQEVDIDPNPRDEIKRLDIDRPVQKKEPEKEMIREEQTQSSTEISSMPEKASSAFSTQETSQKQDLPKKSLSSKTEVIGSGDHENDADQEEEILL